jgi:hypothetical protein
MSGMVHTAKRLLPYAKNKVIHIEAVNDPVLLRLIRNERTLPHLRAGLKAIDDQYEILIPYRVDDEEMQLKRYIQWKLGTTVNLSVLRRDHLKYYLRLYDYGSPADVIRRWGLTPTHDHIRTEESLLEALESFKNDEGVVTGVYKDVHLYRSLRYYASKAGKSVYQYLTDKGIKYKGRNDNDSDSGDGRSIDRSEASGTG